MPIRSLNCAPFHSTDSYGLTAEEFWNAPNSVMVRRICGTKETAFAHNTSHIASPLALLLVHDRAHETTLPEDDLPLLAEDTVAEITLLLLKRKILLFHDSQLSFLTNSNYSQNLNCHFQTLHKFKFFTNSNYSQNLNCRFSQI